MFPTNGNSNKLSFRTLIANSVSSAFKWAQRHRIFPDPDHSSRTRRIGEQPPDAHYSEQILGQYQPTARLSDVELCGDDPYSQAYRNTIVKTGEYLDQRWSFGIYDAVDVKLWPDFGVHFSRDGNFIDVYCSNRTLQNPKYELTRQAVRILPPKRRHAAAIFMAPAWYHNFYHWMVDILPRLSSVGDALTEGLPVVVPDSLRSQSRGVLRRALDQMGMEKTEILPLGNHVHVFDRLVMPTNLAMPLDVSPRQRDFLRFVFSNDEIRSRRRRLYVSRRDAHVRRVANEAEIESVLRNRGFETVTLSHLTLEEQARLFASAEAVIGHHGAGFVNLAFTAPNTLFIEMFHAGHFSSCFVRLAQLGELKYGFLVGQAAGKDTWIDSRALTSLLDKAGI